jgi:hypothetical protein
MYALAWFTIPVALLDYGCGTCHADWTVMGLAYCFIVLVFGRGAFPLFGPQGKRWIAVFGGT